jgi:hypothetical protein
VAAHGGDLTHSRQARSATVPADIVWGIVDDYGCDYKPLHAENIAIFLIHSFTHSIILINFGNPGPFWARWSKRRHDALLFKPSYKRIAHLLSTLGDLMLNSQCRIVDAKRPRQLDAINRLIGHPVSSGSVRDVKCSYRHTHEVELPDDRDWLVGSRQRGDDMKPDQVSGFGLDDRLYALFV